MLGEERPGVDAPGELRILAELADRGADRREAVRLCFECPQSRAQLGPQLGALELLGDGRDRVIGELDLPSGIAARGE